MVQIIITITITTWPAFISRVATTYLPTPSPTFTVNGRQTSAGLKTMVVMVMLMIDGGDNDSGNNEFLPLQKRFV